MANPFEEELQRRQSGGQNPFEQELQNRQPAEQDRSLIQQGRDAVGYAYDWMTGDVESEDLPELGSVTDASTGQKLQTALGYLASSDPKQVQDIAVKTLPGATARTDDQGNPIVRYKDQDYYINRPGASGADAAQITGEILSYLPAAKWASLARSLPRRAIRAAIGEGTTSVARDVASEALGSDQGVNFGRAMMAAGTAGVFEGMSPLAVKAFRRIMRKPGFVDPKTGQLTKKGRKAARTADLDPDDMDARLAQEFQTVARDAPEEALPSYGRMAQARRYDIPLTRGEATRDPGLLTTERNIRHQSEGGGNLMRGFKQTQQESVDQARNQVQAGLSRQGQPQVDRMEDVGRAVRDRAASNAQAARNRVNQAYDEARQFDASISPEAAQTLPGRLSAAVDDIDVDAQLTPAAVRTQELIQEAVGEGTEPDGPTVRTLERLRKKINSNIESAANRTDRRAVTRMKQAFDETVDDAIDQQLYSGDPRAFEKLKEARALRAQYAKQFGDPDSKNRVDKIVGKLSEENPDPSEVVNWTFGWSALGNKGESAKVLKRVRDAVGPDSPEWDQMREGAFFQLVRNAAGDAKSPQQMQTAMKKAYNRNKELLDTLYTSEEQRTIKQFIDTANLTEALPKELGNPSQTAFALRDMLRRAASYGQSSARIHGNFGTGMLFSTIKRMIPVGKSTREAMATTRPLPIPQPRTPLATAAGASIGAQNEDELNRATGGLLSDTYRLGKRGVREGRSLLTR